MLASAGDVVSKANEEVHCMKGFYPSPGKDSLISRTIVLGRKPLSGLQTWFWFLLWWSLSKGPQWELF